MTDAATVVWLQPPSTEARETLGDWARARGLVLVAPTDGGTSDVVVDPALATEVEGDLQRAKDAIAKLDVNGAELALSRAERALHDNPALPQAAWLMAEVQRTWSARWSRLDPKSPERATAAWEQARALDGGRATGVGEVSFETKTQPVSYTLSADVPAGAKLVWDGAEVAAGEHRAYEGSHQLRVDLAGHTLFAGWVSVVSGSVVQVSVRGATACSSLDLSSIRANGELVDASSVRCESWVAARALADGSIAVSTCVRGVCGEAVTWRRSTPSHSTLPPIAHHVAWPAWGTWTIVGVAVLAGVGVALGAAGVFSPKGSPTTFTLGPIKPESLRLP